MSSLIRFFATASLMLFIAVSPASAFQQPRVQPGPGEPDWGVILDRTYHTRMIDDLANPVKTTATDVPGLFRKAGPGPVRFVPEIALGLEVPIRGGYYLEATPDAIKTRPLWSYQYKHTTPDLENDTITPPPLADGSITEFDPGDQAFGLTVSNDQFQDAVFTQPAAVAARNPRLAAQPYKVMIYAYRDPKTGELVADTFLIGWEYSTNDDFQDVVTRVENVRLIKP